MNKRIILFYEKNPEKYQLFYLNLEDKLGVECKICSKAIDIINYIKSNGGNIALLAIDIVFADEKTLLNDKFWKAGLILLDRLTQLEISEPDLVKVPKILFTNPSSELTSFIKKDKRLLQDQRTDKPIIVYKDKTNVDEFTELVREIIYGVKLVL